MRASLDCAMFWRLYYCTVMYCTVLYCTVLNEGQSGLCDVLEVIVYCTVMYCTVLYCTVLYECQSGLGYVLEVVLQLLQLRLLEVGLGCLLRQHVKQDVNLVTDIHY